MQDRRRQRCGSFSLITIAHGPSTLSGPYYFPFRPRSLPTGRRPGGARMQAQIAHTSEHVTHSLNRLMGGPSHLTSHALITSSAFMPPRLCDAHTWTARSISHASSHQGGGHHAPAGSLRQHECRDTPPHLWRSIRAASREMSSSPSRAPYMAVRPASGDHEPARCCSTIFARSAKSAARSFLVR